MSAQFPGRGMLAFHTNWHRLRHTTQPPVGGVVGQRMKRRRWVRDPRWLLRERSVGRSGITSSDFADEKYMRRSRGVMSESIFGRGSVLLIML